MRQELLNPEPCSGLWCFLASIRQSSTVGAQPSWFCHPYPLFKVNTCTHRLRPLGLRKITSTPGRQVLLPDISGDGFERQTSRNYCKRMLVLLCSCNSSLSRGSLRDTLSYEGSPFSLLIILTLQCVCSKLVCGNCIDMT